jgi:hypothetical protein
MRDPVTDAPVGIHRIGLSETNAKIDKLDRKALGRMGVVKLWPLDGTGQLVIGEGIETVLAAATRMEWHGTPLTPAWSAVAKGGLARPPVLREIKRRIQLVDNDASGAGQKAAERGRQAWGKCAIPLMPKETGLDWNDVILRRKVS